MIGSKLRLNGIMKRGCELFSLGLCNNGLTAEGSSGDFSYLGDTDLSFMVIIFMLVRVNLGGASW